MHMIAYEVVDNKQTLHSFFFPSTPPTLYATLLFSNSLAPLPGAGTGQGSASLRVVTVVCRPCPI